jgi:hypothetical protein
MASLGEIDIPELLDAVRAEGFAWLTPDRLSLQAYPVVTIALDDVGEVPDIIKIDAEGAEVEVLAGAQRLLSEAGPVLLVETNKSGGAVRSFLEPFGYRVHAAGDVNTIFAKPPAS